MPSCRRIGQKLPLLVGPGSSAVSSAREGCSLRALPMFRKPVQVISAIASAYPGPFVWGRCLRARRGDGANYPLYTRTKVAETVCETASLVPKRTPRSARSLFSTFSASTNFCLCLASGNGHNFTINLTGAVRKLLRKSRDFWRITDRREMIHPNSSVTKCSVPALPESFDERAEQEEETRKIAHAVS